MGATRFVGRVGALAVALGVGTGMLAGHGIARADDESSERRGNVGASNAPAGDSVRTPGSTNTRRAGLPNPQRAPTPAARTRSDERELHTGDPTTAPNRTPSPVSEPEPDLTAPAEAEAVAPAEQPLPAEESAPVEPAPVAITAASTEVSHVPEVPVATSAAAPPPAPLPAPAASVTGVITASSGDIGDPLAGDRPDLPLNLPLDWALLGFVRREAAKTATSSTGSVAASLFGNSITVDEQIGWNDGVLEGALNATSTRGLPLTYSVVDTPSLGGKVALAPQPDEQGRFHYLPYMSTLSDAALNETFGILVAETTAFNEFLKKLPLIGDLTEPVLRILHQTPLLSDLLAPLIGAATVVTVDTRPAILAAGRPTAFTYKMPSFDGTLISLNYYPSVDVATGVVDSAPIIFNGPDLGFPGNNNIYSEWAPSLVNIVPGLTPLREGASPFAGGYVAQHGFNVITWDPRGEWASGGVMQLDSPFYEARDVSSMISWSTSADNVAANQVKTEAGDPLIGMVGGSYGGGIQFTTAATDPRVDAIVPGIAWNTLNESLYPDNVFKTVIGSELLLALIATGARVNSTVYSGIATGALFSWLSQSAQAVLADAGPGILSRNIDIPTMFLQGTVDILFQLDAANVNGRLITETNPDVPIKTTWFCGGHGVCLLPETLQEPQGEQIMSNTLQWLDQYVAGSDTPIDDIPTFQWYDQKGGYHSSPLNPYNPLFNAADPLVYRGEGGGLLLVPVLGGSGPSEASVPPAEPTTFSTAFALASGSRATNAINVAVTPPTGIDIAGGPVLRFSYSGLGTSRAVYAQLVDNATGQVVGNVVTPVPVTLDGRQRTAEIRLAHLAYNVADPSDSMTLQITSSALPYLDLTAWGWVNISDIEIDIPVVA